MRQVGFAAAGVVIALVLGGLLGVYGFVQLMLVLVGGIGGWQLGKGPPAPNRQALVAAASNQIMVFGQTIDRPLILDKATGLFGRRQPIGAWWSSTQGNPHRAGIPPLERSPLNERRMFESFYESARFERLRRGHELLSRTNKEIPLAIYDEGLLVDTLQNDDGSVSHIVATGVRGELDRDDWLKAHAAGLGRHRSAWDERPYALAKLRRREGSLQIAEEYDNPRDAGVMPLFYCELDEIVVAGEGGNDPLARQDGGVSYDFPEEWR